MDVKKVIQEAEDKAMEARLNCVGSMYYLASLKLSILQNEMKTFMNDLSSISPSNYEQKKRGKFRSAEEEDYSVVNIRDYVKVEFPKLKNLCAGADAVDSAIKKGMIAEGPMALMTTEFYVVDVGLDESGIPIRKTIDIELRQNLKAPTFDMSSLSMDPAQAQENGKKIQEFQEECDRYIAIMDELSKQCMVFYNCLFNANKSWFATLGEKMHEAVGSKGGLKLVGKKNFSEDNMNLFSNTVNMAQVVQALIATNILDRYGQYSLDSKRVIGKAMRATEPNLDQTNPDIDHALFQLEQEMKAGETEYAKYLRKKEEEAERRRQEEIARKEAEAKRIEEEKQARLAAIAAEQARREEEAKRAEEAYAAAHAEEIAAAKRAEEEKLAEEARKEAAERERLDAIRRNEEATKALQEARRQAEIRKKEEEARKEAAVAKAMEEARKAKKIREAKEAEAKKRAEAVAHMEENEAGMIIEKPSVEMFTPIGGAIGGSAGGASAGSSGAAQGILMPIEEVAPTPTKVEDKPQETSGILNPIEPEPIITETAKPDLFSKEPEKQAEPAAAVTPSAIVTPAAPETPAATVASAAPETPAATVTPAASETPAATVTSAAPESSEPTSAILSSVPEESPLAESEKPKAAPEVSNAGAGWMADDAKLAEMSKQEEDRKDAEKKRNSMTQEEIEFEKGMVITDSSAGDTSSHKKQAPKSSSSSKSSSAGYSGSRISDEKPKFSLYDLPEAPDAVLWIVAALIGALGLYRIYSVELIPGIIIIIAAACICPKTMAYKPQFVKFGVGLALVIVSLLIPSGIIEHKDNDTVITWAKHLGDSDEPKVVDEENYHNTNMKKSEYAFKFQHYSSKEISIEGAEDFLREFLYGKQTNININETQIDLTGHNQLQPYQVNTVSVDKNKTKLVAIIRTLSKNYKVVVKPLKDNRAKVVSKEMK